MLLLPALPVADELIFLLVCQVLSAIPLVLMVFSVTAGHAVGAGLTVLAWGAFAFGNVPDLQLYLVQQAQRHAPQPVDVASVLDIAAFNLGIVFGAGRSAG